MSTLPTSPPARRDPACRRRPVRSAVAGVGAALLLLAVATELRKPRAERTWHGRVLGLVPYDLRPPTLARVKESLWSPDDPRLVLPRAFGLGWSPNLGRLLTRRPH